MWAEAIEQLPRYRRRKEVLPPGFDVGMTLQYPRNLFKNRTARKSQFHNKAQELSSLNHALLGMLQNVLSLIFGKVLFLSNLLEIERFYPYWSLPFLGPGYQRLTQGHLWNGLFHFLALPWQLGSYSVQNMPWAVQTFYFSCIYYQQDPWFVGSGKSSASAINIFNWFFWAFSHFLKQPGIHLKIPNSLLTGTVRAFKK